MDGSIGLIAAFIVVLGAVFYTQLETYRKRIRFLEIKVDVLSKQNGLEFDTAVLFRLRFMWPSKLDSA